MRMEVAEKRKPGNVHVNPSFTKQNQKIYINPKMNGNPQIHVNPNVNAKQPIVHINPNVKVKPPIHVNPNVMHRIMSNKYDKTLSDSSDKAKTQATIHLNPTMMNKFSTNTTEKGGERPVHLPPDRSKTDNNSSSEKSRNIVCTKLKLIKASAISKPKMPVHINNAKKAVSVKSPVIRSRLKLVKVQRTDDNKKVLKRTSPKDNIVCTRLKLIRNNASTTSATPKKPSPNKVIISRRKIVRLRNNSKDESRMISDSSTKCRKKKVVKPPTKNSLKDYQLMTRYKYSSKNLSDLYKIDKKNKNKGKSAAEQAGTTKNR